MLRINAIPNSAAAKKYYSSADYYVVGKEAPARWHGKGAEMLGLSGEVLPYDFELLCDNLNPSGQQLTAKHAINRRVGYDFTWSVPKSVSVLYSLGADHRLADAFRESVAETMAEVERDMHTRVRQKGADHDRQTGNMLWADFLHHTSRPINGQPDPQLHIHAVVFNATWDQEEGQWKAGEFSRIKQDAPYFQAAFRTRLADKLQAMGYGITHAKGDFEISGVPERVNHEFSRRTDLIEKVAKQLGITKPETKAKLGATTRTAKLKDGMEWSDLLGLWQKRLKLGELGAITTATLKAREPVKVKDRAAESVDYALRHLLERKSVVDQRQVMTEAMKFGVGTVSPESVLAELGKRKDLIRRDVAGRTQVSTKSVLAEEQRIVQWAVRGRGKFRPLARPIVDLEQVGTQELRAGNPLIGTTAPLAASLHPSGWAKSVYSSTAVPLGLRRSELDNATLSPSQQAAIEHVWSSPDRLILVRGAAGTGKTTLTRTALAGVNVPWVILAPSAEASRGVLRRDGFTEADTLAAFLNSQEMQERVRDGLVWLDEASLTGAHDMHRLVEAADRLNARIVLSGDRRQHKSVSRGDILSLLEDKAGCPAAEVGEIRRQSGEYREAVKLLAAGAVGTAFDKLDRMGWIKNCQQPLEQGKDYHFVGAHKMIADDYLKAIDEGRTVLIVAPTHAEGRDITHELRDRLKDAGKLGRVDHDFDVLANLNLTAAELQEAKLTPEEGVVVGRYGAYRQEKLSLATGDSIRMTANVKDVTGKHRINNGAVYQVAGFTEAGNIRLSNGWALGQDAKHFTHGYAVTSHASQGRTVDQVFVAMPASTFPAVGKEAAYVAVSRGRFKATIYTDQKEELREQWAKEDKRLLASDLVRKPKHRVRQRLKRHLGWLRSVANRGMDKMIGREQEREVTLER